MNQMIVNKALPFTPKILNRRKYIICYKYNYLQHTFCFSNCEYIFQEEVQVREKLSYLVLQ